MPSNRVSRKTLDANYKAQMMSEIEKLKNQILHEDQLKFGGISNRINH